MPAPILPSSISDPTGLDPTERRAIKDFDRRVKKSVQLYIDMLDRIEFEAITVNSRRLHVNKTRYDFRTSPEVLLTMMDSTGDLIDQIMLEGGARSLWFMEGYIEPVYRRGTSMSMTNIAAQSRDYANSRPSLESLLTSAPYQRRLGLLKAREFEEMKGLSDGIKKDMAQILTDGMGRGLNPRDIAENMTKQIPIEQRRAHRIARTEIPQAFKAARREESQQAMSDFGFRIMMMHLSAMSPTTRRTHAERNATLHTIEEQQDWYAQDGNSINCYLPGTKVAGRFIGGSKAFYEGIAIHFMTAGGLNLSVTPNHPIMTNRGLISAHEVTESDYFMTDCINIENPAGIAALNDDHAYTAIEEVFCALSEVGHSFSSGVEAVDFHGDAEFFNENISVVNVDGMLAYGINSHSFELLDNIKLEHSDPILPTVGCALDFYINTINPAPAGFVCCDTLSLPLLEGHIRMLNFCSGRAIPSVLAIFPDDPVKNCSGNSKPFGNCLNGFSCMVRSDYFISGESVVVRVMDAKADRLESFVDSPAAAPNMLGKIGESCSSLASFDKVISINSEFYSGHVYDLEEVSGFMIANGIIASNCKCSEIETLVDENGEPLSTGAIDKAKQRKLIYAGSEKKAA